MNKGINRNVDPCPSQVGIFNSFGQLFVGEVGRSLTCPKLFPSEVDGIRPGVDRSFESVRRACWRQQFRDPVDHTCV